MKPLEIILVGLIGAYVAREFLRTFEQEPQPDANDYVSYDPYATDDPYTAYAGTIEPMNKTRYSPRTLKTSPTGAARIVQYEGRRSAAYQDSAGKWTIGIGHLIVPGDGLSPQSVLSDVQIDALFAGDLSDAENAIYNLVTAPLSQGEFDALADFVFQFGAAKFGSSSLLRLINLRNYESAAAEFSKWINVSGAPSQVLVARRADDARTFLT